MIAVQGFNDENVLFDGIPMKIITDKISTSSAKHFYYYIYDSTTNNNNNNLKDLNIYLTTQTLSQYQIAARVVSDGTFARDLTGK